MAAYDTLRAAIDNYIKANGNKEITGTVLNDILNAMVSALGADTRFAGVAVPSTNPGNPEGNVVYFASQAGTYSNFGGIVLPLGIHILVWNGTAWTSQTWFSVDNTPTQNSQNLALSGGILQAIVDAVGVERLRAIGVEVTSCSFDGTTKKISFFNSANTTLFQLDATAFVIDGMVSDVKIEDGNLVIQFNTDAGKQDIEIPLTDIFNPANYYTKTAIDALLALYYTKTEVDGLLSTINTKLADGYLYKGIATPATSPATPATKEFYLATIAGTYTNFGNIVVKEGITILKYDGTNWTGEQLTYTDGVFDISAYNGTSYADLSAALGNGGANIPQNLRKGGMSVKFVQSSDNKYVQARCMAQNFTTDVADWQGVDNEPTPNSDNLVKSGSVYDIQKDLERTNSTIGREFVILPNGSSKSNIPTTTGNVSAGNDWKAYDYDVENIDYVDIYSNITAISSSQFPTAVLWALYAGSVLSVPIAYGPLLSTGEQRSSCDLSQYPTRKILRVAVYVNQTTPVTEVRYYTTDLVKRSEVSNVLRTTDVVNSLDSVLIDKPLSAKQGKELNDKIITQETLTPTGGIKSMIPTNTGTRVDGGGTFRAYIYDIEGKSKLTYTTDAPLPATGQYTTAVTWALYSSDTTFDSTTVLAVGDLLSAGIHSGNIGLTLYPTAKTLLVTCNKNTAVVTVINSIEKYATKQELDALDERVDELEADSQVVSVVLPNKIHAVKGDRLQVFYRGAIVCLNPNIYNVKALCDVGKAYPRYLHYEASSANVGTSKNLQLLVERSNGIVKAQGTVPIMTINTPSSPASNKNVLVFGASVLGTGSVVNELKRRLTETSGTTGDRANPKGLGLSNITFVGRKRGSAYDVPQEATGGWSWSEYATQGRLAYRFTVSGVVQLYPGDVYTDGSHSYTIAEINVTDGNGNVRCLGSAAPTSTSGTLSLSNGSGDATITYSAYTAENYSPFYNSETHQIDFTNYANAYCNGSIDVMIAHCGTNDIFGTTIESVATTYNNYIKPFIRKYHEQFPNGKFILSTLPLPDMNGGLGASYGAGQTANWWKQAQNYYEFARLAYELEADNEFSSYVTVANVMHLFDTENLYIYGNVPVCNRLPTTIERLGQNGVHPSGSGGSFVIGDSEAGTKTIADALYYAVCANL